MKTLIPFFALALLPAAVIISCGDEEDDVTCAAQCQNGGTCVADTCQCPVGFEGPLCATELRAPVLGSYIANNDNCTGGSSYTVSITANGTSGMHLNLENLGNHGFTLVGTLTIPSPDVYQLTCLAQTVTVNGAQATASANAMLYPLGSATIVSYQILQGGTTTNCTVHL